MSKLRPIEWLTIAAILLIIAVFLAPWSSASIHYFSPDTLESKYERELLCDGIQLSLYRSPAEPKTSKLVDFLVTQGYWQPRLTDKPAWIRTGHFSTQWRDGQSQIHKELYWRADDWIVWSEEKPQLAAEVWPRVLGALRQSKREGPYEAAELLWTARHTSTVKELDEQLDAMRQREVLANEKTQ